LKRACCRESIIRKRERTPDEICQKGFPFCLIYLKVNEQNSNDKNIKLSLEFCILLLYNQINKGDGAAEVTELAEKMRIDFAHRLGLGDLLQPSVSLKN
jgi:hypothetical protein